MNAAASTSPHEVPTWRLHALRAMYALVIVGLAEGLGNLHAPAIAQHLSNMIR